MSALRDVLRQRALQYLMKHNVEVPTKSEVKRGGGALRSPLVRQDWAELRRHPGDSRSVVLDRIKAIAADETGCRVATQAELRRIGRIARRNGADVVIRTV